jgi:hypothetical protein
LPILIFPFAFFQENLNFYKWSPQKIKTPGMVCHFLRVFSGFSAERISSSAGINFRNGRIGYNFVRTKPQKTNAMKTIAKILVAISILMISLQVIAANNQVGIGQVHYKVQIHLPKDLPLQTMNIFVAMTDERGILIAPVQAVRPGLSTYDFNEFGPKTGTRTASLIYNPLGTSTFLFYCAPDSKTGIFKNGVTYLFNLYPTINPPE